MDTKGRIEFSKHSIEKMEDKTSRKLNITGDVIKETVRAPEVIDNSQYPLLRAVKKLTGDLSLCVIYKIVKGEKIKIITFFPARRGRYESKILSG